MRTDDQHPTPPEPATSTTRSTTATAPRDGAAGDGSTGDGFDAFRDEERTDARNRWEDIETRFVDDPAGATEEADALLAETVDRLSDRWHERRSELRDGWSDDDASTEQLRTVLKRYRGALETLLSR